MEIKMFEDLQGRKFDLIYADPPWSYRRPVSNSRKIENHYPTMDTADIIAMPVSDICNENCLLYLWATAPQLYDAMQVITGWGFEYLTCAIWDKKNLGMGYWFRIQHELLLLSRKGDMSPPAKEVRIRSVIRVKKTSKHSQKPKIHSILDDYHPDLTKIELFARETDMIMDANNWTVWGNEV